MVALFVYPIKLLLLSALITQLLCAVEPQPKQLLSPQETIDLLETIKPYGIVFGNGQREVHIFIDPYCPVSQHYLSSIFTHQERQFRQNTYYFYLYALKHGESKVMIETILSSEHKKEMLKAVMVEQELIMEEENTTVEKAINAIAKAAQQIGIYKRPYIIINGKVQ